MRFKFTGDFKELEKFTDQVEKVPDTLITVNEQLAEETIELIREGFERSEDPHGKPWKPPIFRDGRPLEDRGHLKSGWFKKHIDRASFVIDNPRAYATYLQTGTGIHGPKKKRIKPVKAKALRLPDGSFRSSVAGLEPRKMVPDEGDALPERWRRRYVDTAQEVLTELFRS